MQFDLKELQDNKVVLLKKLEVMIKKKYKMQAERQDN